ncbi:NADAR family protein [uncultured Sphingomonas sp.]|uniref:NADAR family protein n=1 Tax=uncultured Sphingomonas sp. TaxID=158754 RepID=UPI0025D48C52|nr:NADAR family protein [uncultured Sphingomonas sp.]
MGVRSIEPRSYDPTQVAVFWKTKERFGGLSNMAAGFPLVINDIRILTSEALYQACRFPHRPDLQELIISEISPMTAKMKAKPFSKESRTDWHEVRVQIMRWCLRVKLCQHPDKFGRALLETGDKDIVEKKVNRTDFWGAKVQEDGQLEGQNVLGRLLMELRGEFIQNGPPVAVKPLNLTCFDLYGSSIGLVKPTKSALSFNF